MEFGALQCIPRNPDCEQCVFATKCAALQNNTVHSLPVRRKKSKVRKRYFNYFVVHSGQDSLAIQQRLEDDIWYKLRSEEHTSELQSRVHLVCRLLLVKKYILTFS